MLTVEQVKQIDSIDCYVGATYTEVFIVPTPDRSKAILVPVWRPKQRRFISWQQLADLINSGRELHFEEIGSQKE